MIDLYTDYGVLTTAVINFKVTSKGLLLGVFEDRYGQHCSIQESSVMTDQCIWFGVDTDINGQEVNARMHLSQQNVQELLPILRHFARTGNLGNDDPSITFQVGTWVLGVGDTNRGIEGRVVEVVDGKRIVVQDSRVSAPEGLIFCAWNRVDLIWEPVEPEYIRSRYEQLQNDDNELG